VLRYPVPNPRKPPLHSWELDRSDVEMGEELGEGLFGVVYKALLKGNTTAAVKEFTVWHNTCSSVFVTLLEQVETLQDIGKQRQMSTGQKHKLATYMDIL